MKLLSMMLAVVGASLIAMGNTRIYFAVMALYAAVFAFFSGESKLISQSKATRLTCDCGPYRPCAIDGCLRSRHRDSDKYCYEHQRERR